jgi:hypothetical protein
MNVHLNVEFISRGLIIVYSLKFIINFFNNEIILYVKNEKPREVSKIV